MSEATAMSSAEWQHSIEQFLYHNAELCDAQDWDAYLETFDENVRFHIPQWDSEHELADDPHTSMSLMFYPSRAGLEDRVFRIRTGKSAACTPMPRTSHFISNVRPVALGDGMWQVKVNWSTHYYRLGEPGTFFGYCEYQLKQHESSWKITSKKVILLNDKINHVLDFYHV